MLKKATRDAYGEALIELAKVNPDVLVLDADLSRSTRTGWFKKEFPDRFFNLGIAEQNMIGFAAGLSLLNYIPFATTYAIFIGRAYDQIRQSVCFSKTNVKIVATHSGFSASHDGGSHQGIEDLSIMRVLPEMVILSPCDYNEVKLAVFAAAAYQGPVYIRLGKFNQPVVAPAISSFEIGKMKILEAGSDISIFATGCLVYEALEASTVLKEKYNLNAEVINVSTIKPLDENTLIQSIAKTACAVTAEEHSIVGGLYSTVCETLGKANKLVPVVPVAIKDHFGETGSWDQLLTKYNINSVGIISAAIEAVNLKKPNL